MGFFDELLKSKGITWKDGDHLWSLRLNENEYHELKTILKNGAKYRDFANLEREATLFFAEWWRREYDGGTAKIENVCKTIFGNAKLEDKFYRAAKAGAQRLKIQIITTEVNNSMYSMFFQGGLPMNNIANEILERREDSSSWEIFFKNLVWSLQDYSTVLKNQKIAPLSQSLKDFCETLRVAADIEDPDRQPYSHNEVWWNVILKKFEEEKQARKARTPFELKWMLDFDDIDKKADIKLKFSGPQKLSAEFVSAHKLDRLTFTSISVLVNNQIIFSPEYDERFYCRRNVEKDFQCKTGDVVTITINETGEILTSRELDFESPKLFYISDAHRNRYRLGDARHLSECTCRIIATEEWMCNCNFDNYNIGGRTYKLFRPNICESITLTNSNEETKTFDPRHTDRKTFIDFKYATKLGVKTKETVFNTGRTIAFYEASSESEILKKKPIPVKYAEKGSKTWSSTAKLGEIRAKFIRNDKEIVEPVRFINAGSLTIERRYSSHDKCHLIIEWPHGTITSEDAEHIDDSWIISREKLIDKRYARFKFKPQPDKGSKFEINILPPFYGFCIYDRNDRALKAEAIIAMEDLSDFRYYLHLPDRIEMLINKDLKYRYSYFQHKDKHEDNLIKEILCDQDKREKHIPFEGRLASLFMDGREQVNHMLSRSCKSLPDADAEIKLKTDGQVESYRFKAFPYRLKYEDGKVIVKNKANLLSGYREDLLAIPIDKPEFTPIILSESSEEQNCYDLPAEITNGEHAKWLIYGKLRGYVLPFAIDLTQTLNEDQRNDERALKLRDIKRELIKAPIFSPIWRRAINWYKRLPFGRIPGTSILELVAVADDKTLIKKFALQLWLEAIEQKGSMDSLIASLTDFSEQMSFIWNWIDKAPINDFVKPYYSENAVFQTHYYRWALSLSDDNPEYKKERVLNPTLCYLMEGFEEWVNKLKEYSYPKAVFENPDTNSYGNGIFTREANDELERLKQMASLIYKDKFKKLYDPKYKITKDEQWIIERYIFSDMYSKWINFGGDDEEDALSENAKREIRKNIILGLTYKKTPYEF